MTVEREIVHLWVERAPSDSFDDESTPRFRVVASLGQGATRRATVPLTRPHPTAEEALRVLADRIRDAAAESWVRHVVAKATEPPAPSAPAGLPMVWHSSSTATTASAAPLHEVFPPSDEAGEPAGPVRRRRWFGGGS